VIAVKAGNTTIHSFEELAGRRVGYFGDPVIERSVANLHAKELVPFDDSDRLFEALRGGRVDAAVEDSTFVGWMVAHDPAFRVVGKPLNKLGYVVGMRRADQELRDKIETAVRELVQSGEMEKIRTRWTTATDTPAR
jgi:ABC-type amino acid transport substrate-binding protein